MVCPIVGNFNGNTLVAGCFGLLKSYHPDWTNDQLITQLLGTADNIDSLNPNYINMLVRKDKCLPDAYGRKCDAFSETGSHSSSVIQMPTGMTSMNRGN